MSEELAVDKIILYRQNVTAFAEEILHFKPDPWQRDFFEAFPHNQRLALQACKGPGKTAAIAVVCWNFLATRPFPKIGATSITGDNLRDCLWAEMATWMRQSPFLQANFTWTGSKIFENRNPETWWMSFRTWSRQANDEQQEGTLAGLHAPYCMAVLDESGGIPKAVMAAADGVLTAEKEGHVVQAGNPLMLEGPLYLAATNERHLWWRKEITADPDDPLRATRVPVKWALDQIAKYGRDNPWVLANVFGRFPKSSINSLIGLDDLEAAKGRHLHQHAYDWAPRILGGDVARFGDDQSVLYPRQGLAYFQPLVLRKMDSIQVAGHWGQKANDWGADSIQIDGTGGYGAGVIDIMRDAGFTIAEVQFAGEPFDPKFYNKRAEIIYTFCEHVKSGASIPDDPLLIAEASTATYTYKKDRIMVEEKDQMKARLGRSPDNLDAAACTHAYPVSATRATREALFPFDMQQQIGKSRTDYDPLERA
jgi:hypothetical protein